MKKIKKKQGLKRIIAAGLSMVVVTGSYFAYKKITDTTPVDLNKNINGYTDINPLFNYNTKNNEFVILDVGNHKILSTKGTIYSKTKMKFCNENNISLGIVINSEATNKLEIYNDIEYAKKILEDYKVDFPVYLSIDNIMENNDLNVSEKTNLIQDFADKATLNGMYFGIYGKDTNLFNLNKYCFDISDYDVYLKEDSKTRKYQGVCNVVETIDGKVTSKCDLSSIINSKKLNSKENFVEDAYYIVRDEDTVDSIALYFGLSVNDLLEYNDINEQEVIEGKTLRIPNDCQIALKIANPTINSTHIKKGVDLSYCQTEVDYNKLSSNVDYAILKLTEGCRKDELFESHITNCLNNGIPIGVYSITRATTIEEVKEEANQIVNLLKNRKVTYPVFIDFEADPSKEGEWSRYNTIKNTGIMKEFLEAWATIIEESGYVPGIYCNKSLYKDIYDQTNSKENKYLDRFEKWIAGTNDYSTPKSFEGIEDPGSSYTYDGLKVNCNMRQVSEACKNIGAATSSGYVDFNYCYTDYDIVSIDYKYKFNIKNFSTKNIKQILTSSGIVLGTGVIIFITSKFIVVMKRKKKKKINTKHR